MPNSMPITLSLTSEYIETLKDLSNKSGFNYSKLFRCCIDYFNKNPNEFKKLVEGDYDL